MVSTFGTLAEQAKVVDNIITKAILKGTAQNK